jgi:uncharacterized OB-fold protein
MSTAPLPHPNIDSQPYWEGAARAELRDQRCTACQHAQFPPRAQCLRCGGEVVWQLSAGAGVIHSYTRVERAPSAAFKAQLPYGIVLVDMAEGFRLMLNLRDSPLDAVRIGAPIRVIFEATAEARLKLPQAVLV